MNKQKFYQYAEQFLARVFVETKNQGVDLSSHWIDHLCWRVGSDSSYSQMKNFLGSVGELLAESMVNGRSIATYRLFEPVVFGNHNISIVECPSPKPGVEYLDGFEHIEVVISERFDDFVSGHRRLRFDLSKTNQKFNPELILRMGTTTVKFHHFPLERVIELESKMVVVWDLDGTIIPSHQIRKLIHRTLEDLLNRVIEKPEFESKFRSNFPDLLTSFEVPHEKRGHFFERLEIRNEKTRIDVYPEVVETIRKLHRVPFVEQVIWTARDGVSTEWCLSQTELRKYFRNVVHSESRYFKPDPMSLWLATDGQDPLRTIVVGDSHKDQVAAQEYGATFIGACWDPFHQLSEGVGDLSQLMTTIENSLSSRK